MTKTLSQSRSNSSASTPEWPGHSKERAALPEEELWWNAVRARDAKFDGQFFFGVVTTGVYCRPSCPARQALRRNVRFYRHPQDAEADGLRACLRCKPRHAPGSTGHAKQIRALCAYIDTHADESLTLAQMSAQVGLSRFHFQRTFKSLIGVTPRQYLEGRRTAAFKEKLRGSQHVADAIYNAGFGSASRAYERADTRLGMTPGEYRSGGQHVAITYVSNWTPIGLMMTGATNRGICFLQFGDSHAQLLELLKREYPKASISEMEEPYPEEFHRWMEALAGHLKGSDPKLDLPLDIRATAFQLRVWNYLQSIPYGSVQSYSEVAAGIENPAAVRAVARACGTNPVALLIPCHRVIRGSGELGGYRWGLARKRALIDFERLLKTPE